MIKKYFYQGYKKVIGLFLIGMVFFSSMYSVCAKTLTVEEVNEDFKANFINTMKELGINFTTSIDTTNKTFNIIDAEGETLCLNYTEEYIEYNNRSTVVTQEIVRKDMSGIILGGITDSILNLSGYEDKKLTDDDTIDFTNTYDTYGIQMETEHFEYNTEKDGVSTTLKGDYIKYFKVTLATGKIDTLMEKYGVDITPEDPNQEIILNLTPSIEAKEITENQVTLYPHISYTTTDPEFEAYCYVYRSTNKNGPYEKISAMAVNCIDGVGIIDDDLNSNTTYYYKAVVMNGDKYSDILEVTTKKNASKTSNTSNDTNKEEKIENPETGIFFPTMAVFILMMISILTYIYAKEKSAFKKI